MKSRDAAQYDDSKKSTFGKIRSCHLRTSQQGSVSVYGIIVFSAIFLFNALLIDFARINIAEHQAELATKAAMRSTLSMFDPALLEYGLFALNDVADGEAEFNYIMKQHTEASDEKSNFRLVNTSWVDEETQFHVLNTLADLDVFKQQIQDTMTYQAPIQFILDVVNKFQEADIAEDVQEASSLVRQFEKLDQLIKQREQKLDEAWQRVTSLFGPRGQLRKHHEYYEHALAELYEAASEIQSRTSLMQMLEQADENDSSDGEEHETLQEQMEQLLMWLARYAEIVLINTVKLDVDYGNISAGLTQITAMLDEAQAVNMEIEKYLAEEGEDSEWQTIKDEQLANIVLRDPSYFDAYKTEMGKAAGLFSGFRIQFEPLALLTGEEFIERYDRLRQANDNYAVQGDQFYSQQSAIEQARMAANEEDDALIQDEIDQAAAIIRDAKQWFTSCVGNDSTYYDQMMQLDGDREIIDLDNTDEMGKQSLHLFNKIKASLIHARNYIYINEYALTYFNYRTSGTDAFHREGQNGQPMHKLSEQEVEYVIYGLGSCTANQRAAAAEIFAMRLAIRTVEALLKPKTIAVRAASPWFIIVQAVAEGAKHAYSDLKKLVQGEEVELSARLSEAITFNYKDYLRLFLFIHFRQTNTLTRMQQLIQLNTHTSLAHKATHIEGHSVLSMRLWFIPGVMSIVNDKVIGREAKLPHHIKLQY